MGKLDPHGTIVRRAISLPRGWVPGTAEFTLGAPAQVAAVSLAMLPSGQSGKIALDGESSSTLRGLVAKVSAGFTAGSPIAAVDAELVDDQIANAVGLRKDGVLTSPSGPNGERVFGLLQAANGSSDGDAIVEGGSGNLQISFVYRQLGAPGTRVLQQLAAGTYLVNFRMHGAIGDPMYGSLLAAEEKDLSRVHVINGSGNPNTIVTGYAGQVFNDLTNGVRYTCNADASTAWSVD